MTLLATMKSPLSVSDLGLAAAAATDRAAATDTAAVVTVAPSALSVVAAVVAEAVAEALATTLAVTVMVTDTRNRLLYEAFSCLSLGE